MDIFIYIVGYYLIREFRIKLETTKSGKVFKYLGIFFRELILIIGSIKRYINKYANSFTV